MRVLGSLLLTLIVLPCCAEPARHPQQLKSLSLEQLGNIKVTTFSKQPEEVWHTPAAIYGITQADIRRSGATTLPELLRMLPGVQVSRIQSDQWDYRFISRLPAQNVPSFQAMDAHLAWPFDRHFTIAANGRSLLQPHRREVTGDNGNAVGILRRLYASLTWMP